MRPRGADQQGTPPNSGHSGSDRRRGRREQVALCPITTRGRRDPVLRPWRTEGGAKGPLCDGHGYGGSGRIAAQCARGRRSPGIGSRGKTWKPRRCIHQADQGHRIGSTGRGSSMMPNLGGVLSRRSRTQLGALLKVQAKLAVREPYALGLGVGFPVVLLVLFGFISRKVPGNVGGSGLTVIDLYIPTIMVISFIAIAISLPNTLVRDREIGWLRRISTTPVHPSRLLAAQLILDLVLAAVAIVILIVGGTVIFGAPLSVGIPFFILSLALAIAVIFSLGLIVVALAPTQTIASAAGGVLFFALLFLSGLWVQPVQVGAPLSDIMWYSPSGAAVRAILYSVFHATPPVTTLVTLAGYTLLFSFVAVRYFRWE